jgi:GNAT superfamily N-acetyltransferase
MRAQEFIHRQLREDIEDFPIANVRRPNGAIGNQGVNTEQAADVLTHAAGMQVSPDMSMRQLVDALKADPAAQQRLRQFVQKNPVTVYALPDGSYHLQDGHHRTFLLNLLGDETVPAVVKEDVTEAKTVEFEGLTLKVIKQDHELTVDALDDWGNKVLGHVKFNIGDGKELDPQDLRVDDKYQGQGIARVMYDYVKSLGYTINRSWDQTDAGAGFWNKHRGEDVRVWESFLDEANASAVQFQTASTDNYQSSFTVTAIADGKTVGHFSFFRDPETDDVHNQAEVTDDVQGKGYGKALLLKAIEVANDHGLGFQEDSQSLSRAQSRVYDSLYDAGWIVDADGYWFLTPEGEQELARISTMQQGMAEARKNPEQNTKYQSGWAELAAWARKNNVWLKPHEWAISMTYVPKLGINPGPGISEDTPRGIYFYPFQWAYSVKMDKEALPWADNAPYIQLFQYSTGAELYDPNQIPLASAVAQLKNYGITDEDIAAEKENYPGISTYNLLVWCLGRKYDDNKRVTILNKVLRNLGYDYMIDNGKGWIAINEPTQGVVLNPKIIDKVVTFNNYTRKKEQGMSENFADGKNPGRKGLAKRSGVNTKASVSSLRKTAKNSSGEKQRMAHWLANMKAGRAKAKRK